MCTEVQDVGVHVGRARTSTPVRPRAPTPNVNYQEQILKVEQERLAIERERLVIERERLNIAKQHGNMFQTIIEMLK